MEPVKQDHATDKASVALTWWYNRGLDLILILLVIYAFWFREVRLVIRLDTVMAWRNSSLAALPVGEHWSGERAMISPDTGFTSQMMPASPQPASPATVAQKGLPEKVSWEATLRKEPEVRVSAPNAVVPKPGRRPVTPRIPNITFVLNPGMTGRYSVETVAEKMENCRRYARRFSAIAQSEQAAFGIPASITLAQGLLESDAGGSSLAQKHHNHFGVKCFSRRCRKGHCANFSDDSHKDFFRIYTSAWESFRDHSRFLQGKRYQHLKQLGSDNYRQWAYGLQKAGYATDKKYAEKLILIVESLDLFEYD